MTFQTMDNQYLRTALGMGASTTGVLINRIQPTTATAQVGVGKSRGGVQGRGQAERRPNAVCGVAQHWLLPVH
jgi:hypothetical protein